MSHLEESSIEHLTLKTVFLIAVTTARRVSELQAFSIRPPFIQGFVDRVVVRVDAAFLPKVVSSFHRTPEVVLPTFVPRPEKQFFTV